MPLIQLLVRANVGGRTRERDEQVFVPAPVSNYLVGEGRAILISDEQLETPEGEVPRNAGTRQRGSRKETRGR